MNSFTALMASIKSRLTRSMRTIFGTIRLQRQRLQMRFGARLDLALQKADMGSRHERMATEEAHRAYQIADRRRLYRRLDLVLWWLGIRYIPKECGVSECQGACPTLTVPDDSHPDFSAHYHSALETVWKAEFSEVSAMVRHDDALNWQKFYVSVFLFGVILTAYIANLKIDASHPRLCILLAIVMMLLAWASDLTFQEGLRCLRSHRRKLAALERKAPPQNTNFLFSGSPYNQRDVLEIGPLIILCISIAMLLFTFAV